MIHATEAETERGSKKDKGKQKWLGGRGDTVGARAIKTPEE